MPRHVVGPGECLASIARYYGFADYRKIYEHPQNVEFKRKRPNPNVIHPGDELYIPEPKAKEESRATGQRHRFQVRRPVVMFKLELKDEEGKPYGNRQYRLKLGDFIYAGRTSGSGLLQHPVPEDVEEGELTVWLEDGPAGAQGYTFPVLVGHLNPVEEISGVQARLNNLGYWAGPLSAEGECPEFAEALSAFQRDQGLPVTGRPDPATSRKLRQLHEGA